MADIFLTALDILETVSKSVSLNLPAGGGSLKSDVSRKDLTELKKLFDMYLIACAVLCAVNIFTNLLCAVVIIKWGEGVGFEGCILQENCMVFDTQSKPK